MILFKPKNMKKKQTIILSLILILISGHSQSQNIYGYWTLTQGFYQKNKIENLSATMEILNKDGNDTINYVVEFDNGVQNGYAAARYVLEEGTFKSNLTGENLAINGVSMVSTYKDGVWAKAYATSLNISYNNFINWGGTIIGYYDPYYSIKGDSLIISSTNGNAVFKYVRKTTSSRDLQITENIELKNYPNPFRELTNIEFNLTKKSKVKLNIYDINGNLMISLENSILNIGTHKYTFVPTPIYYSNGTFICVLDVDDKKYSKTLLYQNN